MKDNLISIAEVAPARRWLALVMLAALSLVLLYIAVVQAPSMGWQVFLLASGGLGLWLAIRMRESTRYRIEMTETELRDSAGNRLALIADIVMVERGVLAFKPSNGFVIRTAKPAPRSWMPGLWWRVGRRVGIGGVTPAAQTRVMADMLAMRVQARLQAEANNT
jgi:hypothetical protein